LNTNVMGLACILVGLENYVEPWPGGR